MGAIITLILGILLANVGVIPTITNAPPLYGYLVSVGTPGAPTVACAAKRHVTRPPCLRRKLDSAAAALPVRRYPDLPDGDECTSEQKRESYEYAQRIR